MTGVSFDVFINHMNYLQSKIAELPGVGLMRQSFEVVLEKLQLIIAESGRNHAAITAGQQHIRQQIAALQMAQLERSTIEPPGQQPPVERTFFTNALAATQASQYLNSHVPPGNRPLNYERLPTTELYGQLHALHENLLEWAMATHNAVINIRGNAQHTREEVGQLHRQNEHLMELLEAIRASVITASSNVSGAQTIAHRLDELGHQIQARPTTEALQTIVATLRLQVPPVEGNPIQDVLQLNSRLPPYVARHPNQTCRTYGRIHYCQQVFRIPMDVKDRARSTTLNITVEQQIASDRTILNLTLRDNDRLLTNHTVSLKQHLAQMPLDALAEMHALCPNFIYTAGAAGLC